MNNSENEAKKNTLKTAERYFQKGQWDKVIEEYQKFLKSNLQDMDICSLLGDIYVKKNDHRQAFHEYNKVAADLINHGQTYKTTEIYKKIMGLDPRQLDAEGQNKQNLIQLHLRADESLAENNTEAAVQCLNGILKIDPLDFSVMLKLAQLFEVLGRNSDAVRQYACMGEVFLKNRQYKKAREIFKQIIKLEPQNIDAHLQLGEIYLKLENEFDAKNEYHKAAEIALGQNDLHAAFEYSLKAVELKSMDAYYVLGVVLFERKKWIDAKMKFDDFLRFKPYHVGAHIYLGKVFDAMEQPVKAVESFQKALKMDKENMMALEVWAQYCVKTGNIAEAIKTYNQLIEKAFLENQDSLALEWARLMVGVDTNLASSQLKLAQVLEKNGDRDAASEVYFNLFLVYSKENQTEEAEKYRHKTLEMKPLHAKALAFNKGKNQPVEEVLPSVQQPSPLVQPAAQKAVSETPVQELPKFETVRVTAKESFMTQMSLADDYFSRGLLNEAIDLYQQLIAMDPGNSIIKEKLNRVYATYAKTEIPSKDVFERPSQSDKVVISFVAQEKFHQTPAAHPKVVSTASQPETVREFKPESEKKTNKKSKRRFV
jgi:tetratricopeptide (TPR) repeat protein